MRIRVVVLRSQLGWDTEKMRIRVVVLRSQLGWGTYLTH
jgi:hypothetical protein